MNHTFWKDLDGVIWFLEKIRGRVWLTPMGPIETLTYSLQDPKSRRKLLAKLEIRNLSRINYC